MAQGGSGRLAAVLGRDRRGLNAASIRSRASARSVGTPSYRISRLTPLGEGEDRVDGKVVGVRTPRR